MCVRAEPYDAVLGGVGTGDHTPNTTPLPLDPTYTLVEMLTYSTLTELNSNSTHAHSLVGVIQLKPVVEDIWSLTTSKWADNDVRATKGRCEGFGRPSTDPPPFPALHGGVCHLHLSLGVFKGWVSKGFGRPPTDPPHPPPLGHDFIRLGQCTTGRCEGFGRPPTDPPPFPASYGGVCLLPLYLGVLQGWVSKGIGRPPTDPPHPPPLGHDFVRPGQCTTGRCEGIGRPPTDPPPFPAPSGGVMYAYYPSTWACYQGG